MTRVKRSSPRDVWKRLCRGERFLVKSSSRLTRGSSQRNRKRRVPLCFASNPRERFSIDRLWFIGSLILFPLFVYILYRRTWRILQPLSVCIYKLIALSQTFRVPLPPTFELFYSPFPSSALPFPPLTSYLRVSRCFSSLSQIVASSITTIIRRRISPGRMQSENIIRPSRTSINAIGLTAKRREMSTVVAA